MADNTITFEYNGATFTVAPATIGSNIRRDFIHFKLKEVFVPEASYVFGQCVAQTRIDGDPGFTLPEPGASLPDLQAAFEAWLALPGDLGNRWQEVIRQVNAPSVTEEYQPEVSSDADPE